MKIIFVGSLSKKRFFPSDLTDTEVWGLNAVHPAWVPRWDRRLNLHTYANLRRYKWKEEYFQREVEWSAANPGAPYYTLDEWPEPHKLAGWQQFPAETMMDLMVRGRYHCGSFDWMVAFAIWLNERGAGRIIHEIELHGVHMSSGVPISARACLEYWCGRAEGAGIKISLAEDAHLFDFYHLVRSDLIYGIHDTPIYETKTAGEIQAGMKEDAPYDYED
jgi:hypothetical protein